MSAVPSPGIDRVERVDRAAGLGIAVIVVEAPVGEGGADHRRVLAAAEAEVGVACRSPTQERKPLSAASAVRLIVPSGL